jgi:hypothetical protein
MEWPAVTIVAILMGLIHTAASRGRAIKRGGEVFRASLVLRGSYFIAVVTFITLGLGFLVSLGWREIGWLSSFFFGVALTTIIAWPSTIVVTKDAVQSFRPFRKLVAIPKDEILAVVFDPKRSTTLVCGQKDSIEHGNYHVASAEFRRLLARWCKIEDRESGSSGSW